MKKSITKIGLLFVLPFLGCLTLVSAPPVAFTSKGAFQVSPLGKMYVSGGIHMFPGAVGTQDGLTVLTGDFLHDASGNVFTTNYSGTVTGVVEFRGTTEQQVTTSLAAYANSGSATGKMDRKTMYLKFPDFKVNNGNRVVVTPSMGVSVNKLVFTNGKLRLKSDATGGNDQDASLLVEKTAEGYSNSNHMEIERNVKYNAGKVTNGTPAYSSLRYMGFSAPLSNMYLDYFTDHWVFDQRLNAGAGGYDIRRYQKFDPGIGYFVVIRRDPNTTVTNPNDYIKDNMVIINENFLFNRTYYEDFFNWNWNAQVPAGDNPKPQEVLNTGNVTISGGLKKGDNYLGNPYTCALNVDALFTSWGTTNIKPSMWIWTGQGNTWLTITKDMGTADSRIIPSQQLFVIEGVNAVGSFNIPASARTHHSQKFYRSSEEKPFRNELLIEVVDEEMENYSRMVVGLRSWGKVSGDDESDVKFLRNDDETVPQVYAVVPSNNISIPYDTLTINSLPENTRSSTFDFLPSRIKGNRKYILNFRRQESLETEMVILVDKKEKQEINLRENDIYEFYADMNDNPERFTILFAPSEGTHNEEQGIRTRDAYFQHRTLYIIQNSESDVRKPVEVYNASGLLVYKDEILQTGTNSYDLNLPEGVYIVKSGEMVKKFKK